MRFDQNYRVIFVKFFVNLYVGLFNDNPITIFGFFFNVKKLGDERVFLKTPFIKQRKIELFIPKGTYGFIEFKGKLFIKGIAVLF